MKSFYKSGLLVVLVLLFRAGYCQDSTITARDMIWYSDHNVELHSNTGIDATCRILTHSSTSVDLDWAGVTSFSVVSVDGTWSDPSQDGSLIYHVLYQQKRGDITIKRAQGEITITIDLTPDFADGMQEKFVINRFE
jgi:hypothetical protein